MPQFTYKDMKVSVGALGAHDVRIQLRFLDEKLTLERLGEILYPIFDAEEKRLHAET